MMVTEHIENINKRICECRRCDLWKTRSNPVVGEGDNNADILFIGEAPGFNEDKQGRPFVGRAGKLLDELLESIDLKRNEVYIANILKCRPPNNRNPEKEEIESCTEFLDAQIKIISPKIIVPLGNFAVQYIFKKYGFESDKISNVHGKIYNKNTLFGPLCIIPLYHPAIAIYNPTKKNILMEDILVLNQCIDK